MRCLKRLEMAIIVLSCIILICSSVQSQSMTNQEEKKRERVGTFGSLKPIRGIASTQLWLLVVSNKRQIILKRSRQNNWFNNHYYYYYYSVYNNKTLHEEDWRRERDTYNSSRLKGQVGRWVMGEWWQSRRYETQYFTHLTLSHTW